MNKQPNAQRALRSLADELVEDVMSLSNEEVLSEALEDALERAEIAEGKMRQIQVWIDAYPLEMFPEPDFAKANAVLKEHGIQLGAISASNMRHVLTGISDIIKNSELSP